MLRKTLIVAQFGISVFLIIYTVIIMQQMHYMQTKNLGYDKDHVVVLPIGGSMFQNFKTLKDAFQQVRGVEGVTASYETPEFVEWGDGITAIDEKWEHLGLGEFLPSPSLKFKGQLYGEEAVVSL